MNKTASSSGEYDDESGNLANFEQEKQRVKAKTNTTKSVPPTFSTKKPRHNPKKTPAMSKEKAHAAEKERAHSSSYTPDELLLVTKFFMTVSSNTKYRMDKKAEKFWEDTCPHHNELVLTTFIINE